MKHVKMHNGDKMLDNLYVSARESTTPTTIKDLDQLHLKKGSSVELHQF